MKKEKNTVVIIGSLTKSMNMILRAVRWCKRHSDIIDKIYDPIMNNNVCEGESLTDIQLRYINYIKDCDFVILIKKPDGTIGESTSYELALSYYFEKPVFCFREDELYVLGYDGR